MLCFKDLGKKRINCERKQKQNNQARAKLNRKI